MDSVAIAFIVHVTVFVYTNLIKLALLKAMVTYYCIVYISNSGGRLYI